MCFFHAALQFSSPPPPSPPSSRGTVYIYPRSPQPASSANDKLFPTNDKVGWHLPRSHLCVLLFNLENIRGEKSVTFEIPEFLKTFSRNASPLAILTSSHLLAHICSAIKCGTNKYFEHRGESLSLLPSKNLLVLATKCAKTIFYNHRSRRSS